ncbi:MAG: cyclic lactone autoinducer peptide [Clostridia bacterium]|nr:cyclic lactone autoinducer peptide [Clostridia bacterium]
MKKVFDIVATIVTALAVLTASTACWCFWYQPKVPKSLSK